jgi:ATP-dependent helicase Lhr and Lhr-like helicase
LTSRSGRTMLSTVHTVIVDEIHALAGNKRGAHLGLSLERLVDLCQSPPTRVGISATTNPLTAMAEFLTGRAPDECVIIDEGHARNRDLALELPQSPLEAIMANEVWTEIYDRLAELVLAHRTTLIFVNTRRLAERAARHLAERLGEDAVTSHHGSLAKEHRLKAETLLKAGKLRALVATASLELGIDIGDVDLVCQLGSPHAIATFLQRVGRSGHGLGRVPKGRLFPLSRDELVESAALLASVRRGDLDRVRTAQKPLDVLAQQIVAEVGMREYPVTELLNQVRRAACYRELSEAEFMAVVAMLADGFSTQRGRRGAHLHFDRVNGVLRGRRGAALTAVTNGGAIPDQFDYDVVLLPAELSIGTLNEDFAFESMPGDIFQLGNTSYRILKVRTGKVYVEDARGKPPNIPFWFGEAPGRTDELSQAVSDLRQAVDASLSSADPAGVAAALAARLDLTASAATQLVDYLAAARAALGALPTMQTIVLERFFDETGDTHLVIHSPFGSRLNRAWGLALRKRFCRRFNFELQAAALEDSIVLSLGAVHSFALEEVIAYLHSRSVRDVLMQAALDAALFPTYWRWNSTIALAVRRFHNGRRAPPQFQRSDAEDLLATVFPDQLACAENLPGGDIEIPDHPLVAQTMRDCLHGAMDIDGLERLLRRIEAKEVEIVCCDLAAPSPLAQEILGAKPYAFLDDAPAEERRTLAVQTRRFMNPEQAAELGRLDPEAIRRVQSEAWPAARDADELHDALVLLGFVATEEVDRSEPDAGGHGARCGDWRSLFAKLRADRRAVEFELTDGRRLWVSAERLHEVRLALPDGRAPADAAVIPGAAVDADAALRELVRSRLEAFGPVTAAALALPFGLTAADLAAPLAALEQQGVAMRGRFSDPHAEQWCERRMLARIHRYTLQRLRNEIEPVSLSDYQRFLFVWQGLGESRREGAEALLAVLAQLEGLALPAATWERDILPARIAAYGPTLMDALCTSGAVVWWRPRPSAAAKGARAGTVAASPIAIVPRDSLAHWQTLIDAEGRQTEAMVSLSTAAEQVVAALRQRGALFFLELVQLTGLLRVQVEDALGELVARGLVTADAYNGLRAVLTPQRHRQRFGARGARRVPASFDAAGRWTLLEAPVCDDPAAARGTAVEHAARVLLHRYGVVARAALVREALTPSWRELLDVWRRWEARGEIRGGRFVAALGGEQFALPEAVAMLRRVRRDRGLAQDLRIAAADPLHLDGIASAVRRSAHVIGATVVYRDGALVAPADAGQQTAAAVGAPSERSISAV